MMVDIEPYIPHFVDAIWREFPRAILSADRLGAARRAGSAPDGTARSFLDFLRSGQNDIDAFADSKYRHARLVRATSVPANLEHCMIDSRD